jgi:hypothetical protein
MTFDFTQRVTVPDSVMLRQFADEAVILNLDSESYFGLDPMATAMWNVLTESSSIQAGFETLLAQYEVDAERLRRDFSKFIDDLLERGLLKLEDGD